MSSRYPSISYPEPTIESLFETILDLKQAVEILTGQRGAPDTTVEDTRRLVRSLLTVNFTTTISGGTITLPSDTALIYFGVIETEGGAASDDLDYVHGGKPGTLLLLRAYDDAHTVVAVDSSGNLDLAGGFSMDSNSDILMLVKWDSNWWVEVSSRNNA